MKQLRSLRSATRATGCVRILLFWWVCSCGVANAQTVVVTGSATPVTQAEADRDLSVFSLPPAERALFPSWFQLLQLDPALDLRQRAPGGFLGDLSIRGSSFAQTLVLLDGFRLNDAQTGHFNLDLPVPLEAIRSMEVVKGSASTLYGSDAVGGVVNVRTEVPVQTNLRLLGAAGNFGVNQEHALASWVRGGLSEELGVARDFSSGFAPDRDYRNLAISSQSLFHSSLGASFVLLALSDRPYGADQFYGNYPSWERTKTWFAVGRQDLGNHTQASFAYRRHTDLYVLVRDRPAVYQNNHVLESWQADVRRQDELPLHAVLSYGLEALGDRIDSTNLGHRQRTRTSGYVLYDLRALRKYSLSVGLREERYGSGQWAHTPSLSGAVWLSPHWKARGTVSRAFRLPSFTDLYYNDPSNLGNPGLRPETAANLEAGVDWFPRADVHASATFFYRRDSNLIDYVRASVATPWQATNYGRVAFRGWETSVAWQPPRWGQVSLALASLDGWRPSGEALLSKYAFSYVKQSGVAAWQGKIGHSVLARTRLGVVNRLGQDPYALWDVSAGYARGRARPFLQLTNLGGAQYQEIPPVFMPGRAVVGGIEVYLRVPRGS